MAVNNLDNKALSKSEYPRKPFSFGDFLWSPKWRPFRYQNIHIIIQLLEKSSLFKFTGSSTKKAGEANPGLTMLNLYFLQELYQNYSFPSYITASVKIICTTI